MVKGEEKKEKFRERVARVAEALQADVLLYNGNISESETEECFEKFGFEKRRKNIFLLLITGGGDPHMAYRIATALQREYERFIVCIPSKCKSAGTLITIGAHEIVMADRGELGPLDVQALETLRDQAFSAFENSLLTLKVRSGITLKTCLDVATQLTAGLFKPIYEQIDPMRLGENTRAMTIGQEYGERLNKVSKNLKEGALQKLLAGYPSHVFVINLAEAKELFRNVRPLTQEEMDLIKLLDVIAQKPLDSTLIRFITSSPSQETSQEGVQHVSEEEPARDSERAAEQVDEPAEREGKAEVTSIEEKRHRTESA